MDLAGLKHLNSRLLLLGCGDHAPPAPAPLGLAQVLRMILVDPGPLLVFCSGACVGPLTWWTLGLWQTVDG